MARRLLMPTTVATTVSSDHAAVPTVHTSTPSSAEARLSVCTNETAAAQLALADCARRLRKLRVRCGARNPRGIFHCPNGFSNQATSASAVKGMAAASPAVNVCSLGGGPAFDHVALSIAAAFLVDVQPVNALAGGGVASTRHQPPQINTAVYDLYADQWSSIIEVVLDATQEVVETSGSGWTTTEVVETSGFVTHPDNTVQNESCDIRSPLEAVCNTHLATTTLTADIFIFSFVLHENASFLRVEDGTPTGSVGGCLVGKALPCCCFWCSVHFVWVSMTAAVFSCC